jgi:hypothetical protein
MNPSKQRLRTLLSTLPAVGLLSLVLAGALVYPDKAWSDDRDLLGTSSDKPYVFFVIDTSSSMRRFPGDEWVPGANDDPNSLTSNVALQATSTGSTPRRATHPG